MSNRLYHAQFTPLLAKLSNNDPDYRYMGLNDIFALLNAIAPKDLSHDPTMSAKLLDGFATTLKDTNGEVQNMAIKCLAPFSTRIAEQTLRSLLDRITQLSADSEVDISIPSLALRTIVVSLPRPRPNVVASGDVREAYSAISSTLFPRLLGSAAHPSRQKVHHASSTGMIDTDIRNSADSGALDLLIEAIQCFGPCFADQEVRVIQQKLFDIIESAQASSALKKKTVSAMAAISLHSSDATLSQAISRLIEGLRQPHIPASSRKLYFTIFSTMARTIPARFGPNVKTITPFVLSALSEAELEDEMTTSTDLEDVSKEADEVREAALTALESFVFGCKDHVRPFVGEIVDGVLRYLRYDPNIVEGEDDDDADEMADFDEDDFEEEAGFDDDDDLSWKVRRSAVKVLNALIETRGNELLENGSMYSRIAPALVARFAEREEGVRVENLNTLSLLIKVTCPQQHARPATSDKPYSITPAPSRKRRRGGSDASIVEESLNPHSVTTNGHAHVDTSLAPVAAAGLAALSPQIMGGSVSLLKSPSIPTQQAAIILLENLAKAHGEIEQHVDTFLDPLIDAVKVEVVGSNSAATSINSYRVHALQLLSTLLDTQSSAVMKKHLNIILSASIESTTDRSSKVAVEALRTAEEVVRSIVSLRSTTASPAEVDMISSLFTVLEDRISTAQCDTEVRQQAVRTLGVLLALTFASPNLLGAKHRSRGLALIEGRLKNELTALDSIQAVKVIAMHAQDPSDFSPEWVRSTSNEIGRQLNKASRALSQASASTLAQMCQNKAIVQHADPDTLQAIVSALRPILAEPLIDTYLLVTALIILTVLVKRDPAAALGGDFLEAFSSLLTKGAESSTHSLTLLLSLVQAVGASGRGQSLMDLLLNHGISTSLDLNGRLIGTLLASGQATIKQGLGDFLEELKQSSKDEKRTALALTVLGELALRQSKASQLTPSLFSQYLSGRTDRVHLTAALALGRAAVGNVDTYLSLILDTLRKDPAKGYLLLHSLREYLYQIDSGPRVATRADEIWKALMAASQIDDNKGVAAECVGKLVVVDPVTYLPQLQAFLRNDNNKTRGIVISALRFTLSESDDAYDGHLRSVLVLMLSTMLQERDLENMRAALATFDAAAHSKPAYILPHMDHLITYAINNTIKREELIKQVKIGPFTTTVDDGLELRKTAYQTVYSLLDTAPFTTRKAASLDTAQNLDNITQRTIEGLSDDHDIRMLCLLMLTKLIDISPETIRPRLDVLSEQLRTVLETKPKENAVKQELEKLSEAQRGAVRVGVAVSKKLLGGGAGAGNGGSTAGGAVASQLINWEMFWGGVKKAHAGLVKTVEDEVKDKEA